MGFKLTEQNSAEQLDKWYDAMVEREDRDENRRELLKSDCFAVCETVCGWYNIPIID